jgi:uncharacterized protein YlbG (UPF0298 family)
MSDIRDRYGKVVYRIRGDRIYDVYCKENNIQNNKRFICRLTSNC